MSIELFKINIRKAVSSLLPFARENKFTGPEDLMKEVRKYGLLRPERSYIFLPYKVALTIEERKGVEIPMFSASVWDLEGKERRPLDEEEKKEVISAMEEAFPDHNITVIDGGFLGNPPPFKVFGVPKALAQSGEVT